MPERSSRIEEAHDAVGEYALPYISKSRVMKWLENPEHFRLKYLEGIVEPETEAMRRGTDIHETFEHYYHHVRDTQAFPLPDGSGALPDDHGMWADYIAPYVSNFFRWEQRRWEEADHTMGYYAPLAIEGEHWIDPPIEEGGPEWMGLADAVLPSASVPGVEADEGVTIIDFKTGNVPDERYRHPGIYTELEYYTLIFENEYNVTAAAGYYPRHDELVVKPDTGLRDEVLAAGSEMLAKVVEYDGGETFHANSGPLCGWSPDPDDRSAYYGVCSQCTWNVPVDNEARLRGLAEQGLSNTAIAEELGCEPDEVSYWRRKLSI